MEEALEVKLEDGWGEEGWLDLPRQTNSRERRTGAPFLRWPSGWRQPGAPAGSFSAMFFGTVKLQLVHVSPWALPYLNCGPKLLRRFWYNGWRSSEGLEDSESIVVEAPEKSVGSVEFVSVLLRVEGWKESSPLELEWTCVVKDSSED
jgi:hypothetical protein